MSESGRFWWDALAGEAQKRHQTNLIGDRFPARASSMAATNSYPACAASRGDVLLSAASAAVAVGFATDSSLAASTHDHLGAVTQRVAKSSTSRAAAERDTLVSRQSASAQLATVREWRVIPAGDRFAILNKIQHPTVIVHGNKDVVVMPMNAFLLAERMPNARLIMYPDVSHGAQSQHAEVFLQHVKLFLQ
jgi:pimeloyl-ACP methyl ester carboxylesterase